jgi:carboxynorspermidine decarboxylase
MGFALADKSCAGAGRLMAGQFTDGGFRTPYYLIDETLLVHNLEILQDIAQQTGCKILLAQKAFSMFRVYPLLRNYLAGTTASGLYEAQLGHEAFGGETHVFCPAYRADEFDLILQYADDIVFNSPAQVRKYAAKARAAGKSVGLRINPEHSTQKETIYDPCAPGSRLGTTAANFDETILPLLDGLHFHTLCEQNSPDLASTFTAFAQKFGKYLHGMKWLNLGGGHHITRPDYDRQLLIDLLCRIQKEYQVQVYLEPGEAVVLNAGFLVASVLETMRNSMDIAILDTSAACHMPDVLEMPYRPPLLGSGQPAEKPYTYRLGGPTCLAGDIIGDYSFNAPLQEGQRLIFQDMALYTMVKNNTFNGMPLPDIILKKQDGTFETVRSFGYQDFKNRLS